MAKLEFDDELSRIVEVFNASTGAVARRKKILKALELSAGDRVLDVGSGPGNQAFEMSIIVGDSGHIDGVDSAERAIEIARQRCSEMGNVNFQVGEATNLPFDHGTFDVAMSSKVFEFLDDVVAAIAEMHRVLKPGGRVLIHDTDWGATLWYSSDPVRMTRIMEVWDRHLADPHLPQTLNRKLTVAGFKNVCTNPFIQIETKYNPSSVSGVLMNFIEGYVVSQGVAQREASDWAEDLRRLDSTGDYFFSLNEYIFTAVKP